MKDDNIGRKLVTQILYVLALFPPILLLLLAGSISTLIISLFCVLFLIVLVIVLPKFKNIFLGISIPISIILFAELVIRVKFSRVIPENIYTYKNGYYFNKPNLINPIVDDEYQALYITDESGIRIPHPGFKHKKPEWVFFGDSYTQGAQVNYFDLYTSKLQERFPNIGIVNLGISGFSLIEHRNFIKEYLEAHHPKKVFLQLCVLNDFLPLEENINPTSNWLFENSDMFRFLKYNYYEPDSNSLLNNRWVLPFSRSDQFNIKFNVLDKRCSTEKSVILSDIQKQIISISRILKNKGIEFSIILIPTKEQVIKYYYDCLVKNFNIKPSNINLNFTSEYLKSISNRHIKIIDALKIFRESEEMLYFQRDEHLNKAGHLLLSRIISTQIKK
jgi:hypothetical protein